MIQSMTGYGQVSLQLEHYTCDIEAKSVNSKALDLNLRLPHHLKSKESLLRSLVAKHCVRGKIELSVILHKQEIANDMALNPEMVTNYINQLRPLGISRRKGLALALQMPNIWTKQTTLLNETSWPTILEGIKTCISKLTGFRTTEGTALHKDFMLRMSAIRTCLTNIPKYEPERLNRVKNNLKELLNRISTNYDDERLEQELVYYAEKYDIEEEKTRLQSHLAYFEQTLDDQISQGKKLGFILQEMGREINTIGSKANHFEIQKNVVQMKDALENMKEQVLNIL